MRRLSTVTFMGVMALTMAGCGSDNQESSTPIPSNPQPSAKAFDKALLANQSLASPISSAPILIQPTNGNQRAKQVEKGRRDPFAGLFAQAGLSVPIGTNAGGTNAGGTNAGSSSSQLPRLSVPSSGRGQTGTAPSGSARPRVGQQNSGSNPAGNSLIRIEIILAVSLAQLQRVLLLLHYHLLNLGLALKQLHHRHHNNQSWQVASPFRA
jgi:hypothetical protein